MKRILISLLALILALSTLLVGCNEEPSTPNGDTPGNNNGGGGQNPPAQTTTFTKTENYMSAEVFAQMKTYFESKETGFLPYDVGQRAPLVSTDVFGISNAKVKSITIPVFSTGQADENGDLTFSIYVLPNTWKELRAKIADPDDPIVIKINAAEHGLEENKVAVRKFVKVDLTEYEICLEQGQTLGFSHADDTLIPARVVTRGTVNDLGKEKYAPAKFMIDNWDRVGYFYYNTSESSVYYTDNSLFFDFELEYTWETEAAYNAEIAAKAQADADYAAKLAAVKAAYGDKCFSLIGDSISTFEGVTNDPAVHPSLSKNRVHYTIDTTVYDHTKTYWGKLSVDTGMDLCVINAWSGGTVYGVAGDDNMLTRSYNLTTGAGKKPDVIFLYYATNDLTDSPSSINDTASERYTGYLPTGDLTQRLMNKPSGTSNKEVIAQWFAEVEQKAKDAGYVPENPGAIIPGKTYVTWEAAYALALQNVKRLYGDAEIFCFTLAECNHSKTAQPRLGNANLIISALAEYFEVGLVDHKNSEINKANCHTYGRDTVGGHPNGRGHALITKLIVETLYEKLPK